MKISVIFTFYIHIILRNVHIEHVSLTSHRKYRHHYHKRFCNARIHLLNRFYDADATFTFHASQNICSSVFLQITVSFAPLTSR